MIRYLTDEHIPNALVDALRGRGVEVVRIRDIGLASTPDPDILEWAALHAYVFVTFDRSTVPGFAHNRVRMGITMPGVAVVDHTLPVGVMLDELHTAAECGTAADFRDLVVFFPL